MRSLLLLLCLFSVGCMKHKIDVRLPDVVIPKEAIVSDVVLEGCKNVQASPPAGCKRTRLSYRKGSEKIQIHQ